MRSCWRCVFAVIPGKPGSTKAVCCVGVAASHRREMLFMCFPCCAGFSFPSVVWGAAAVQHLWDAVLRYKHTCLKRTKEQEGKAVRPPASPASLPVALGGKRVPRPRPSAGASTRVCPAHLRAGPLCILPPGPGAAELGGQLQRCPLPGWLVRGVRDP